MPVERRVTRGRALGRVPRDTTHHQPKIWSWSARHKKFLTVTRLTRARTTLTAYGFKDPESAVANGKATSGALEAAIALTLASLSCKLLSVKSTVWDWESGRGSTSSTLATRVTGSGCKHEMQHGQ